jgi:hypothetical protein
LARRSLPVAALWAPASTLWHTTQTARVFSSSASWVKIWLKKPNFTVRYHVNDHDHLHGDE